MTVPLDAEKVPLFDQFPFTVVTALPNVNEPPLLIVASPFAANVPLPIVIVPETERLPPTEIAFRELLELNVEEAWMVRFCVTAIEPLLLKERVFANVPPTRSELTDTAVVICGFAEEVESPMMTVEVDMGTPFDQFEAVVQLVVVPFQ